MFGCNVLYQPMCKAWKPEATKSPRSRICCEAAERPPQQQQSSSRLLANESPKVNGNTEGLGTASPDVLRLFSETQRNLLELNRSRLSALDELRVAKNRISDLESQLEARAESSGDQEAAAPQHKISESRHKDPPPSTTSQQAVAQNIITVAYRTGWPRVMMHYSADSQTWTELPGVEMQPGKEDFAGCKVLQVRGNELEFVLNDGAGQWDTPDPYGSSQTKNYIINTPGKYRLEAGEISQLQKK
ncbi:hypothetical protein ABBQ32_004501 [Trebouxia sp. C0010 RCD-2024]